MKDGFISAFIYSLRLNSPLWRERHEVAGHSGTPGGNGELTVDAQLPSSFASFLFSSGRWSKKKKKKVPPTWIFLAHSENSLADKHRSVSPKRFQIWSVDHEDVCICLAPTVCKTGAACVFKRVGLLSSQLCGDLLHGHLLCGLGSIFPPLGV